MIKLSKCHDERRNDHEWSPYFLPLNGPEFRGPIAFVPNSFANNGGHRRVKSFSVSLWFVAGEILFKIKSNFVKSKQPLKTVAEITPHIS